VALLSLLNRITLVILNKFSLCEKIESKFVLTKLNSYFWLFFLKRYCVIGKVY